MPKFLIIRFSSIGDIILTTPVIRSLRKAYPHSEIHYLTKHKYSEVLQHNPHINKFLYLKKSLYQTISELKSEKYDAIFDLHNNLRTNFIALTLPLKKWRSFRKCNWDKFLITKFKKKNITIPHVVERYGETLQIVNTQLDNEGLDFFIPDTNLQSAKNEIETFFGIGIKPVAIALGSTKYTKKWLPEYFVDLIKLLNLPTILLGGENELSDAHFITQKTTFQLYNVVSTKTLTESAALIKHCRFIISHDSSLMHIAAALKINVLTIWGNTIPEFGMYPYKSMFLTAQVENLNCRPCSRLGYDACPKGHFRCIRELYPKNVIELLKKSGWI